MSEKLYLNAEEVAETMGISVAFAYKIMRELNAELKQKGYIVVSGRVTGCFCSPSIVCTEHCRAELRQPV